jgi:hypothetical protein
MALSPRLLRPKASGGYVASDADARAYITAVSAADGSSLETAVQRAINDFVGGCKADGIWSSIKASCILMGAKTLAGALTPLVGPAPTNNGPFVSGDYNRTTGLIGNGSTKSIDTLRDNNADPQNSFHLSVYATAFLPGASVIGSDYLIGDVYGTGVSGIAQSSTQVLAYARGIQGVANITASPTVGFWGVNRASATQITSRSGGTTTTTSSTSQAITQRRIRVLASNAGAGGTPGEFGTQRIAFYSIGESLTLALLDARVAALYNAIGAAL